MIAPPSAHTDMQTPLVKPQCVWCIVGGRRKGLLCRVEKPWPSASRTLGVGVRQNAGVKDRQGNNATSKDDAWPVVLGPSQERQMRCTRGFSFLFSIISSTPLIPLANSILSTSHHHLSCVGLQAKVATHNYPSLSQSLVATLSETPFVSVGIITASLCTCVVCRRKAADDYDSMSVSSPIPQPTHQHQQSVAI